MEMDSVQAQPHPTNRGCPLTKLETGLQHLPSPLQDLLVFLHSPIPLTLPRGPARSPIRMMSWVLDSSILPWMLEKNGFPPLVPVSYHLGIGSECFAPTFTAAFLRAGGQHGQFQELRRADLGFCTFHSLKSFKILKALRPFKKSFHRRGEESRKNI